MLLLTATTHKIQIVTNAAGSIDVDGSFMDMTMADPPVVKGTTSGDFGAAITTATTTDVLAAPAASTIRNVKEMTVRNKHASVANDVTVIVNRNATLREKHKVNLQPGECLEYVEGVGFFKLGANDARLYLTNGESSLGQNVLSPIIGGTVSTFVMISGTAYFVYVGRIPRDITVTFIEVYVTGAGAGAQTAEMALYSSPAAPNKTGQTLTRLGAGTGTVDALTATGMKRNTTTFAQAIAAGTHLWAAMRTALATTQPTVAGLGGDMSQGHVLTTTGGGALTGVSAPTGTIPAINTATIAPELRVLTF